MGLTRSTFYDASPATLPDDGILARIGTICNEFECYGYRRIGAALRHQGVVVNGKKLRRRFSKTRARFGVMLHERKRRVIGSRFAVRECALASGLFDTSRAAFA